jgi:suppressor of ftsI
VISQKPKTYSLFLFFLFVVSARIFLAAQAFVQTTPLPEPPQVQAKHHVVSLTLHAVNVNGKDTFAFNDATVAPVIRASPGDILKITYVNDLPARSAETCAPNPCMDMTNLHFHGLTVSPDAPQDDVLTMLARPGQALHYSVQIPRDHQPGLFWYHTHPHGESERQVLDGMSGAIVIEGMERYAPGIRGLRERVLILRGLELENDTNAAAFRSRVEIPSERCGSATKLASEIFTVNGAARPQIRIAPNERQFWRIVNASADRYLDLQLDGQSFEVVALDGMPLAYHDPKSPTRAANHLLLSPAGRLEAIVTGPAAGRHTLRTLCVDTGPTGAPNPGMVLADLVQSETDPSRADRTPELSHASDSRPPVYKTVNVEPLKKTPPDFTVRFTEDKNGFYINGQKFTLDASPMTTVRVGGYQHWRIVNESAELHPFHIHQVHFLAYAENDAPLSNPAWLDTVNVPVAGSVDVILDFTDPVIKGMSVFHCHLLNHEDKGMMAKILFK